jgi:hypothetical protein
MKAGVLSLKPVRAPTIAAFAAVVMFSVAGAARAEDDATKILKASTDYVATQKSISASFDSDIEVITPDLQKIQFTSSEQKKLSRPTSCASGAPAAMRMSS